MDGKSLNITEEKLDKLKEIIPEAFTENKIDWEKLKAALGDDIEFKNERYVLNWAGKSDAFRALQSPSTATLVPCREESVNFDKTQNIFIEGENLEVLKVLQKSYFGKIKMIYIDPPYNTGNDNFIYPDKFAESREEYLNRIGDKDETGFMTREGLFRKNSKDSGHYHSNWLSMMYPRLFLARNLLRDDGVIFVSIDDNEVHNLRLLMNEVFGEENFLSNMVWEGAIKNDSKFTSISHDYILCYAKALDQLKENDGRWRTRKEGIDEIYKKVEELKKEYGSDYSHITERLREWFSSLPKKESAWQHRHYCRVDEKDVYFAGDISWPGGGGPRYEILHPKTKKPVKIPSLGWRFAKRETMLDAMADGRIDFGVDENKVPTIKRYLHETEGQVLPSVFYQDRRAAMQRLRQLMGGDIFENPKDESVLTKLAEACSSENDIILDFFSGSATTAHAVLALNKEDNGNRKFIMVQLPEKCDENSEAYKAGYKTIAEIGKERIRRVIEHLTLSIEQGSNNGKQGTENEGQGTLNLEYLTDKKKDKTEQTSILGGKEPMLNDNCSMINADLGFKVFKLQESNFKIWRSKIETEEELVEQLQQHLEPLDEHAKTEDVLYELLLKSGVPLTARIEKKNGYILVNDKEIALMLEKADDKIIKHIIAENPRKVLTLDRLFKNNDQLKTNTALQMKDAGIGFKVI